MLPNRGPVRHQNKIPRTPIVPYSRNRLSELSPTSTSNTGSGLIGKVKNVLEWLVPGLMSSPQKTLATSPQDVNVEEEQIGMDISNNEIHDESSLNVFDKTLLVCNDKEGEGRVEGDEICFNRLIIDSYSDYISFYRDLAQYFSLKSKENSNLSREEYEKLAFLIQQRHVPSKRQVKEIISHPKPSSKPQRAYEVLGRTGSLLRRESLSKLSDKTAASTTTKELFSRPVMTKKSRKFSARFDDEDENILEDFYRWQKEVLVNGREGEGQVSAADFRRNLIDDARRRVAEEIVKSSQSKKISSAITEEKSKPTQEKKVHFKEPLEEVQLISEDKKSDKPFSFTINLPKSENKDTPLATVEEPKIVFDFSNNASTSTGPVAKSAEVPKEKTESSFSFTSTVQPEKPLFQSIPSKDDTPKPVSFSSSLNTETKVGTESAKSDSQKPLFTFSATQETSKSIQQPTVSSFSFGTQETSKSAQQSTVPSFSFGVSASKSTTTSDSLATQETSKPALQPTAPAFSFGATASSSPTIQETLKSTTAPSFSFGFSEAKPSESLPASSSPAVSFNFSAPKVTPNLESSKTEVTSPTINALPSFTSKVSPPPSAFTFGQSMVGNKIPSNNASLTATTTTTPSIFPSFTSPIKNEASLEMDLSDKPAKRGFMGNSQPQSTPFSFGSSNNNFNFTTPSASSEPPKMDIMKSTPSFGFAPPSQPTFSMNSQPLVNMGISQSSPASFSFGGSNTYAPSSGFSFGAAPQATAPPTFNTQQPSMSFNFGMSSSTPTAAPIAFQPPSTATPEGTGFAVGTANPAGRKFSVPRTKRR